MSTQMPDMSQLPDAPIPSQGSQSPSVVNDAVNAAQPVAEPTQAPTAGGSLWKSVVTGALQGLAGSGGATHFGAGLAGGASNVIRQKQIEIQNQRQAEAQASSIKFQDAQAAASVAQAARNNAAAAAMPQEARDAHMKAQLEMADQLQQLGITPTVIADDSHDAAKSALEGLTSANGAVPHLFNLEVGGQHLAYDLTQLSGTPQGLTVINNARAAQGQDPITATQWRSTPKAAQSQTAEKALQFWAPPPTTNAAQANGLYLQYKSFADAYAKKPDADPQVVQRLNGLVSNLKNQKDGQVSQEKGIKGSEAYATAAAQKQARNDVDQSTYQNNLAQGDVTGWKPSPKMLMSEQQFNAARTKFVSGALAKAQDTEKSYQMFQDAYANKDNDKTGASSMLALSQHLGTTFGNVKGARITKDMIAEHLGARSVSDSALVATQKLRNGDRLSPAQWDDFRTLISEARAKTWTNTVREAHSMGLPVTSDMLPQQKGQ